MSGRRDNDDALLALGLQIAARLRDEDRADVRDTLNKLRESALRDLVICLAACVDVDQPPSALLAWAGGKVPKPARMRKPSNGTQLRPCGTDAAYYRHRRRGEDPCAACKEGMRPIWRQLSANRTARKRERAGTVTAAAVADAAPGSDRQLAPAVSAPDGGAGPHEPATEPPVTSLQQEVCLV
jgi:hypothetical protein